MRMQQCCPTQRQSVVHVSFSQTSSCSHKSSKPRLPSHPIVKTVKIFKVQAQISPMPEHASKKTEHTIEKVGLHPNIIFKKIFGHSLNYSSTGGLQTLLPPQGNRLRFFFLILTRKSDNYDTATDRKFHKMIMYQII